MMVRLKEHIKKTYKDAIPQESWGGNRGRPYMQPVLINCLAGHTLFFEVFMHAKHKQLKST